WNAKRQVELDSGTYARYFSRQNRLIAVGVAVFAGLVLPLPIPLAPAKLTDQPRAESPSRPASTSVKPPEATSMHTTRPETSQRPAVSSPPPATSAPTTSSPSAPGQNRIAMNSIAPQSPVVETLRKQTTSTP